MGSDEDDCNALVMVPRTESITRKKNKENDSVNSKNNIKLSKFNKRRARKLEESNYFKMQREGKSKKLHQRKMRKIKLEKEKSDLIKRSIDDLEKYKIPECVGLILQASCKLGQVETMLEKRRKAVQYFKSGLDVPEEYNNDSKVKYFNGEVDEEKEEEEVVDDESVVVIDDAITTEYWIPHRDDACSRVTEVAIENDLPFICENDNMNISSHEAVIDVEKTSNSSLSEVKETSGEESCLNASVVVVVSRPSRVLDDRKDLPIVMMEQEIMEAINYNSTVIICGETGCGKTTQLPQFVYEAGYGSDLMPSRRGIVGVTQPRRVAVLATARRLAYELGFRLGNEVGFRVRYDKKMGENCSIKVMTDGILLREIQGDLLLRKYSIIIVDEAHERSLNTDILIGMLSRVLPLRQQIYNEQKQMIMKGQIIETGDMIFPLKIILMSATLCVKDFISGERVFHPPPPVIDIPTRQFPVTIHFSKRTDLSDYITAAYKKVLLIHKNLPPGSILVFLTGQREVHSLCQRLQKSQLKHPRADPTPTIANQYMDDIKEIDEAYCEPDTEPQDSASESSLDSESETGLEDEEDIWSDNEGNVLEKDGVLDSLKAAFEALDGKSTPQNNGGDRSCDDVVEDDAFSEKGEKKKKKTSGCSRFRVLPLYAMLSAEQQMRVFEEGEEGERVIVVATNVAETSLTIPGVKYVVDTGREKVKNYSQCNGMVEYKVQWISKASAAQRAGRSGRTGPGHCYRLYSSAVFNNMFPDFSLPEISKTPVDGVVLLMKSMGIHEVENFPFPTPPESMAVKEAEKCLQTLGAVDERRRLTPLGSAMAKYPMSPRHSRMLLTVLQIVKKRKSMLTKKKKKTYISRLLLLLAYSVAVVAALSFPNPLMTHQLEEKTKGIAAGEETKKNRKKKMGEFRNQTSDALTVAGALRSFELSNNREEFCREHSLHLKTMEEMLKLRRQVLMMVFNQSSDFSFDEGIGEEEVEMSWRSEAADDSSNKLELPEWEEETIAEATYAGWADRVARRSRRGDGETYKAHGIAYKARGVDEKVYLHSSSSVGRVAPEFVVYTEVVMGRKRAYMDVVTGIDPGWVGRYGAALCSTSGPVDEPGPFYDEYEDMSFWWVGVRVKGEEDWELPLKKEEIEEEGKRVEVFADALMEGRVLPCLGKVKGMMKVGGGGRRRWELVRKMRGGGGKKAIGSWRELKEAWNEDGRRLYREISEWFVKGENWFDTLWMEMLREALLEPEVRFSSSKSMSGRRRKRGEDFVHK